MEDLDPVFLPAAEAGIMSLIPHFQNRAFAPLIGPNVRYKVDAMSWAAIGGCKEARLAARGDPLALWELAEMLRCPIAIQDEYGNIPWWGYVSEAKIPVGPFEFGITLDSMSNSVQVAYSLLETGAKAKIKRSTSFAEDAESTAEYGTRQIISSQGDLSDAAALARRDTILAARRWPQGVFSQAGGGGGEASLNCRGWWDTLGWQYASVDLIVGASYLATSTTVQAMGDASAREKVMQQFTTGSAGGSAIRAEIYANKVGAPTDNLTVGVYALDGSGNPTGAALASGTIAGANLLTSQAWVTVAFSAGATLAGSTQYGLQVSRSGGADGGNYYQISVNTALGYSGGAFKIYNGASWAARSPDADMPFVVYMDNNVEVTAQITDLATDYGEFITAIDVEAASVVSLPSYLNGETTALQEISKLLLAGGINGRRLLADVDTKRRLKIHEETGSASVEYKLSRKNVIQRGSEIPLLPYMPPVGEWVRLVDVIPANVDLTKLSNPTLQFIEGATWAESGLTLQFRGQPAVNDMFKLRYD